MCNFTVASQLWISNSNVRSVGFFLWRFLLYQLLTSRGKILANYCHYNACDSSLNLRICEPYLCFHNSWILHGIISFLPGKNQNKMASIFGQMFGKRDALNCTYPSGTYSDACTSPPTRKSMKHLAVLWDRKYFTLSDPIFAKLLRCEDCRK